MGVICRLHTFSEFAVFRPFAVGGALVQSLHAVQLAVSGVDSLVRGLRTPKYRKRRGMAAIVAEPRLTRRSTAGLFIFRFSLFSYFFELFSATIALWCVRGNDTRVSSSACG